MAFVFAALRTGSSFLAATGVDRKMTDVVQALLVLALLHPAGDRARSGRSAPDAQAARRSRDLHGRRAGERRDGGLHGLTWLA